VTISLIIKTLVTNINDGFRPIHNKNYTSYQFKDQL